MKDIVVLCGTSIEGLTRSICRNLTLEQGQVELRKFSNGETSIEIKGSVREKDVFIVQSGSGNVNDNFMELLILISACKTASAKRVTVVLPFFPYSRQPENPKVAMDGQSKNANNNVFSHFLSKPKEIVTNASAINLLGAVDENGRGSSGYNGSVLAERLWLAY